MTPMISFSARVLLRSRIIAALLLGSGFFAPAAQGASSPGVSMLRSDALVDPLGLDDAHPTFSWRIDDSTEGARQSAYRVTVFSSDPKGESARADVWDSGRVTSSVSNGVTYQGAALEPTRRYFWRVEVWGKDGQAYPLSSTAWWETGLMDQSAWRGKWVGYESAELHSLRNSGAEWITNPAAEVDPNQDTHHDFRMHFSPGKSVRSVVLYTTGEDTADAWVNGAKVLSAHPLPPWKQMPWMTYERHEITSQVRAGDNLLAIGITHYAILRSKMSSQTPMSACVYIVYSDGTTQLLISDTAHWKAGLNVKGEWWNASYDDSGWPSAEVFQPSTNSFGATNVGRPWPTGPVSMFRRSFTVDKQVVSARLYATALGAYKFHLNGKPVGDQILAPGWMDFREHVPYQVYDVTGRIKQGSNAIGAYLAPGWYSTPLKWFREGNNYGDTEPALRAQLRLQMADGSVVWISTDEAWKAELSEIRLAEIYDGETRDERLRAPGWDAANFKDAGWHPATVVEPKEPRIVAQNYPPIREERVMKAKAITSPASGVYILDFGQNMAAVPRLRVRGQRGDDIKLRFAEVLNPDGTLYVDNLRTAKATDHFILAGSPEAEEFQPEFTFHGFRYMEVTGVRQAPTADTLEAVVLHTDAPFTVEFATGNKMVNQLWSNVLWGQRSNFVGLPTDCPQRDERLGWTADAQVFWRTATFNMDLDTFTQKFSGDLRGTQVGTAMYGIFAPGTDQSNPGYGVAWSDAGVIILWTGWVQSGDRRIIEQNWDAMEKYLAAIEQANPDHLWQHNFGAAFGDWLTPTITTPEDLIATAYWAYDAAMMQQMALAVGHAEDAAKYGRLHEAIKSAFEKTYVQSDGTVGSIDRYPSIPPPTIHPKASDENKDRFVETQTGYVLALHMDLLPQELRQPAAKRLIAMIQENNWLLGTGFLGTPYLLEVLSDTGHSDVAYRLLLNTEYPSWGYLIEHGATTTWERWNGDQMRGDPSMNSYNHYAYGAVAEWMYRYAAGVDTDTTDPGFHRIALHPNFDGRLKSLSFDYQSVYGAIHSDWRAEGEHVKWNLIIPPNTSGMFHPKQTNAASYLLHGHPLEADPRIHKLSDDEYQLAPGSYALTAQLISP
jgi:alpha-L-rhamnosidase